MKRTFALLSLLVALSLPALTPPAARARQATPAQAAPGSKTVRLAGLRGRVTVRRDERGIPHVEAASDEDLYFAQGYLTASDRLWQMDLLRRTARGELAEIFGSAVLEEDKRHRTYGFGRVADETVSKASPRSRAVLEAYARGVNAYLASLDEKSLPPEFVILQYRPRPWTPSDTVAVGKNFAEVLSTTWQLDLTRAAFTDLPAEKRAALFPVASPLDVLVVGTDKPERKTSALYPPVLTARVGAEVLQEAAEAESALRRSMERVGLYAEDLAASNNWVVSGKHTATGKPLLANDPHLPPSAPGIWYMIHLKAPGLDVAGVTAPGAPGVIIGHNEQIAWGMTNLGPDVQDIYRERFDPANPRRYMTPTGWRDAEVRREEIKVRKNPLVTETETVAHEVTVTRHGPVVLRRGEEVYALRWTALDSDYEELRAFDKLNRARNWREFREALRDYRGPTQNFVYADREGHIGYYGAGLIPLRRSGDGSTPYDGSSDAGEWTGFIPFDELPHVFDPPSGIIVTANSRVVGTSYPHHLTHSWAAPTRSRRILEMLSSRRRMTAEDFRAVQRDAHSISAATFAREVVEVAREAGLEKKDGKWPETVKLFDGWDGELAPDSRAARLAAEMSSLFRQKMLAAAVGAERVRDYRWANSATLADRIIEERPRDWLPKEYAGYAELLDAIHGEARAALTKRLGADESQWTWGREALARFPHPLAVAPLVGQQFVVKPFPQTGSGSFFATPNVGSGVSMRLIADPSDWDKTQQGIPLGESGLPTSPHWQDQLADWQAATPRPFPFSAAAVARAARETVVLEPAVK